MLGHSRRGELVSEMSVLSDQPRMCSVVAVHARSKVLELLRSDFLSIVAQHPEVMFGLTEELIRRRIRRSPAPTSPPWPVIPKAARSISDRFVASLRGNLIAFGSVGVMRPERCQQASRGSAGCALRRSTHNGSCTRYQRA